MFVQYLKSRPDESQVADSLRFLLAAMGALKKRNPLTESFLVQLDVDLEVLGARIPKLRAAFPRNGDSVSLEKVRRATTTTMILTARQRGMSSTMPSPPECPNQRTAADCSFMSGDYHNDNNNPTKTPEIIEIDPSLTSNNPPQQPIPSLSGLGAGRWPSESSLPLLDRLRRDGANARFFGSSLMQDLINAERVGGGDLSLSPDGGPGSDRPTPNSSASASDRQQSGGSSGHLTTTCGGGSSSSHSFEASPASSSSAAAAAARQGGGIRHNGARAVGAGHSLFGARADLPIGLEDGERAFNTCPETPKNNHNNNNNSSSSNATEGADGVVGAPAGDEFSWDSFAAGATGMTPGMTPMSEGVLRTMLQMGPMETMDLGWDNPP